MWDTPSAAITWLKTFAINNEDLLKETDVNIYPKKQNGNCFILIFI